MSGVEPESPLLRGALPLSYIPTVNSVASILIFVQLNAPKMAMLVISSLMRFIQTTEQSFRLYHARKLAHLKL